MYGFKLIMSNERLYEAVGIDCFVHVSLKVCYQSCSIYRAVAERSAYLIQCELASCER